MTLALVAALAGALGYGAGSVFQAYAAGRSDGPSVLRHPAYLAGGVCDGAAWLASLVAVRHLPLFAVQSILAGSLGVTVVLARLFLGVRARRRDAVALVFVVAALVGVAAVAGPAQVQAAPGHLGPVVALALACLTAWLVLSYRRGRSAVLAVLAGLAFSGSVVCARIAFAGDFPLRPDDLVAWAVIGFGIIGMLAYARALEGAAVGPATAILWVVEVLVAGLIGVLALGDAVPPGRAPLATVCVTIALAASVVLARSPGQDVVTGG